MYELPLFPLNTVLFPGIPIVLHIFEERYKALINRCVDERKPFGVVLIEEGVAEFGPASPHQVGCTADIVQVERLDNGRMNIVAIGQSRFRIVSTDNEQPYLQGQVENVPIKEDKPAPMLNHLASQLRSYLEQYVEALHKLSDIQVNWDQLPDEPIELAYLAAYVLQVPSEQKQMMLTHNDASHLLRALIAAFRTEVSLIGNIVETGTIFSLN
ncbi:MAG: LON peptidase substrate-binding domain-containing protein [Candidatus Promineifilaceae bacterium]